jgi:hypothetical protein
MSRALFSMCLLLQVPIPSQAAWIDASVWSISVEGTADGPLGPESFTQTETVSNELGTRLVAGSADAFGTDPDGIPDGTQSSASAEATVAASSISVNSHVNYVHGTPLGFSSDARAQGEITFDVTQAVMTNFELIAGGDHGTAGASLKDESGAVVWEVIVPELHIGILWNDALLPAAYPFRRDWMLTPGLYTLSLAHSTVPVVGTSGPSSFEFRFVPEPSAIDLFGLLSLALVWRSTRRANRLTDPPAADLV